MATLAKRRQPVPAEIWVLVAAAFLIALGFGIVAPILPQFAQSFDVGVMAASAIVSVFAFVRLIFAPAGGAIGPVLGGDRPVDEGLRAGTTCTFAEENRTARAEDGTPVRCTVQDDGGYRWERG